MIQFLKGLLFVSASLFLLSGAWLCLETVQAERAIATSAAAVPGIVDSRLASIQQQTLDLAGTHLSGIETSVNGAVRMADRRIAGIQGVAEEQLAAANRELATVTQLAATTILETASSTTKSIASISQDFHQIAVPIAGTAAQLNDAGPLYLNCEFNPDCLFNRVQGTSKAIEKSAQSIAKAAPQIADNAAQISTDVRREVDSLTKPKRWWNHIEDVLKVGIGAAARIL